ncbi:MAG: Stp1/IreP family PP2C-type Ser/Thr phosphatase [Solobacterium sp.]|jgi:protein phosphatase|nr:Stp1/IreP family PP2C-type Ser/Thr phosphatase [Solobacterium sp.]
MKYYGITDRGKIRKTNQDNYVIASNANGDVFAMICDGIGGGRGGDVASHMAVSYLSEAFSDVQAFTEASDVKKWLKREAAVINAKIFQMGNANSSLKGMGTTLTGVVLTKVGKFIVNIGDSRVYGFYSDGRFLQLTMDHTLMQDMITHGELSREEAATFSRKNVLTNALGVWESIRCDIDLHQEPVKGFLLCSDGLHGYVSQTTMKEIVQNTDLDPSLRARRLIRAALEAGGFDNVTAILIDLDEGEH